MNFVYLSPHFPPNYIRFPIHLHEKGVNVLGIGDVAYDALPEDLRKGLTGYTHVANMQDYDAVLRTVGRLTHEYGKIDRVESLNEFWIPLEGRLREDFNIAGPRGREIALIRHKSLMKKGFKKAGVRTAAGTVAPTLRKALNFAKRTGYPVIAKPDDGVGASSTYKCNNSQELERAYEAKPEGVTYFIEEFIEGKLYTFDGLTDRDGNIVFHTGMTYSEGIMDAVNKDTHVYYYTLRDYPAGLQEAGEATVRAFDVRDRFFHFEYFITEGGDILGLEVNMRPPGGLTTDMWNYSNNFDIYRQYADVIVDGAMSAEWSRPMHCCYISRKDNIHYAHSDEEARQRFGDLVCSYQRMDTAFRNAIGDRGFLARAERMEQIQPLIDFLHETV